MPSDSTGNRMGGFFGAYVAFHLALLVLLARRRQDRLKAIAFAALTAITAALPQSHELRYYLYWMLTLVALNLVLACQRARAPGNEGTAGAPGAALGPPLIGIAGALALAAVLASTRMAYVYPSGDTLPELLASKVRAETVAQIRDGERVCLPGREPWTFLYAAKLHPGRSYVVLEAERPEDCGDHRPIE